MIFCIIKYFYKLTNVSIFVWLIILIKLYLTDVNYGNKSITKKIIYSKIQGID
jgi:hypothetical protein